MALEILVPTLGESVTEATVAKWFKAVGETVAADEPLLELETDKVTLEVNAASAGVLAEILADEGAEVEVGALLGRIDENGGAAASQAKAKSNGSADKAAPPKAAKTEAKPAPAPQAAPSGEAVTVVVPALGESVTEATVAKWFKAVGEAVGEDEPLVELETDKVTLEVNAPAAGTLAEIAAEEGATVEVGALLGRLAAGAVSAAPEPPEPPEPSEPKAEAPRQSAASGAGEVMPMPPSVQKLVAEHDLDPTAIPATGKGGRLTKGDVLDFIEKGGAKAPKAEAKPAAAPAARPAAPSAPSAPGARAPDTRGEERVRMTRLRQRIAERLKEAQNTAAMLTTFNEVDMGAVMALRSRYKESFEKKHGAKLGFMSFFAKACVLALKELPAVNAQIEGDEIVYKNYYDIGVAVGTEQGLVVPVVRDCDRKSFAEIEAAITDLGLRARDGKLTMDELTGGTFTITNGGIYGSLMSTPILNPPQSGILGMHKIQPRPMAVGDKMELRPMMYLAMSYDHRIVDGREAVTFLVRVKEAIEDPQRILLDM